MHEREEGFEVHTIRLKLKRLEIIVKGKCLGPERSRSIEKEWEKWNLIYTCLINRKRISMDRGSIGNLSCSKSQQKGIYGGSGEDLSQLKKDPNGSRICQTSIDQTESTQIWLDGSKKLLRMCWAGTQKSWWIEKLSRFYWEETQKSPWIENL